MPPGDLVKYVIGGSVPGDTWSIGFWQQLTGLTSNPTQAQMDAAALFRLNGFDSVAWSAAGVTVKGVAHSGTFLSFCKAALYRNGVLTQNGSGTKTPVAGTGGGLHPNYVALVVTLRTASAGRSHRGRVYLPATGVPISASTGRINTNAQPYADGIAAFLTGLGPDDVGFPGDPASHAVVVSRTTAVASNITSVSIDDKPDTQRGRENKLLGGSVWSHSV
jgi:hypothetical protein